MTGFQSKRNMAIESMVDQEPRSQNWGLNRIRNWKLHFCLWPRTCFLTRKRLWLTKCYTGMRLISGPGNPIEDIYYIDKNEFIIWNLMK